MRSSFSIAVVALIAAGCTTITEHSPAPADWPDMLVVEHRVGFLEMEARCYKYVPTVMKWLGGVALACAEIDFKMHQCDIWYIWDWTREHEHEHCRGHDHEGEATLAKAWSGFKTKGDSDAK